MGDRRFEELEIWKLSLQITREIYKLTSKDSIAEDTSLRDRIRNAIVSLSSIIVEGYAKNDDREFAKHLAVAKVSCAEIRNKLYIAMAVDYLTENDFELLNQHLLNLSGKIDDLIVDLKKEQKKQRVRKAVKK
jgi:four helix bundle protein